MNITILLQLLIKTGSWEEKQTTEENKHEKKAMKG